VGHVSKSSGFIRREASQATVSQSGLKTGGAETVGGAHDIIAEIMLSGS
jgi:hypothetical protein